jgi:anti-sigma factor RsiW
MKLSDKILVLIGHCLPEGRLLAFALDGLEGAARAQAKAHLLKCRRCQARLRDLMELQDALAAASPAVEPPPDLARRILAGIKRT